MKCVVLLAIFSVLAVYFVESAHLGPNFGAGDISGHLKNKNYILKQLNCVLGKGACDNVGKQLKGDFHFLYPPSAPAGHGL